METHGYHLATEGNDESTRSSNRLLVDLCRPIAGFCRAAEWQGGGFLLRENYLQSRSMWVRAPYRPGSYRTIGHNQSVGTTVCLQLQQPHSDSSIRPDREFSLTPNIGSVTC